ncbi:MAG: hypothetical protein A2W93_06295 [Bacteroidetes bacterium GWF2_43_63]|nr:MAG: hypothetical protein A2W94_08240 [Bacteroidetes bacterium GWE2_42_42]OFY53230.1 MAG: hypothetical protein A2W93_06295 [Bacteroidetes bacterium GWF2_43_63]HBG71778.1 hypothetical protein [Bacteroidales bacterium]HCB61557.1 hypothetical protein [Bacteroidales bacterium]HCY22769.1 hypothetical protein [Bacteroidales bacterium]
MRIKIPENQITFEQLKADVENQFPQYAFHVKTKNFLVARKNGSTGANILLRKSKVVINGGFPTMGGTLLFMLCIFLLGFLIPLIVYFIVFHKNQKQLETEIGTFIQQKYGLKI